MVLASKPLSLAVIPVTVSGCALIVAVRGGSGEGVIARLFAGEGQGGGGYRDAGGRIFAGEGAGECRRERDIIIADHAVEGGVQ